MALTTQQLATLKTAVLADPTAAGYFTAQDGFSLLAWCNALAAPVATAWKSSVTAKELDEGADYSTFDSLVAGKRDAWALFLQYAPRDMGKNKNRKVVTDVWGNATAASIAEGILQAATGSATNAEKALGGSNTVSTGTVSALRLTFEGNVSDADVAKLIVS